MAPRVRIVVLGARGHTGRLLVPALEARGVEVEPHGREVDVTDASAVREAVRRADAVVNLAGPFLRTGPVPIEACLRHSVPYVDTTGEQAFLRLAQRRYHERARASGTPVVNALAYEYAFADLAAAAHLAEGGAALHVLYRSGGARGSRGTKKSVVRALASPRPLGFEDGAVRPVPVAAHRRRFATSDGPRDAASFPGGDALLVPRHAPFRSVRSYAPMRPARAVAARALAPLARFTLRGPVLRAVERRIDARHVAPDNASARAEVVLEAEGPARRVVVRVGDPYAATAEVCAEGVVRLARSGKSGVLAPAEALDARSVLDAVARRLPGFEVQA